MTFVSIVLGILLVAGGFSCMFTPLATFLSTGYYFMILLLIYGIVGIIRFCRKQSGGAELLVSILSVIVGLVSIFRPGRTLVFDRMVLIFIACWLVIQGLVTIAVAIRMRRVRSGWFWGVIVGILGILAGAYSFAHPVLTALTAGVLIGCYFVQAGLNMIVLGTAVSAAKDAVMEAAADAEKSE